MAYIPDRDEIFPTSSMHNFSNDPSLMQSYTKVPCSCITIYTSITYGTVPCVTLQKVFSYICTVSTYTRYNCEFENQAFFTNDPLPIQIGQEYFIKLFKYKFQGGWFIQFKIQYCGHGLCWCWPLTVEHSSFSYQEYPECSGFQAGAKDLFISFGICPMNQSVYSECGVFVFIFSKCTVCFVLVFVSFNLLVLYN